MNTRVDCEYTFHKFTINKNEEIFGRIVGDCSCESEIQCFITKKDSIIQIECIVTRGKDGLRCGMRSTRAYQPPKSGKKRKWKKSNKGKGEVDEHINPGNGQGEEDEDRESRPWNLDTLHDDPIYALQLLKINKMHGELTVIQPEPLTICYSTLHQIAIYRSLHAKSHLRLILIGIPSMIKSVQGPERESGPVISYQAVTTVPDPISLTQMLSESTEPFRIASWLNRWIEDNGLGIPGEVITDGRNYLTAACIRIFSGYRSMNEYSNLFFENYTQPCCIVRIDAVYILRRYLKIFRALKDERVVECYKTAIVTLILCEEREEAEKVIRALLTVSLSVNEGAALDGTTSATDCEQKVLLKLRDENSEIFSIEEIDQDMNSEGTCDKLLMNCDDDHRNEWYAWGLKILTSVKEAIANRPGNPSTRSRYLLETLFPVLIDDLQWLPLWSCIAPGTSACVENPAFVAPARRGVQAFKESLGDGVFPIRADIFVEKHKEYIDGSTKDITLIDEINRTTPEHLQFHSDLMTDDNRISIDAEAEESTSVLSGEETETGSTLRREAEFIDLHDQEFTNRNGRNVSETNANETNNITGDDNALRDDEEDKNINVHDTDAEVDESTNFSSGEETGRTSLRREEEFILLNDQKFRNSSRENVSETDGNDTYNITVDVSPLGDEQEDENTTDQDEVNQLTIISQISCSKKPPRPSKLTCCSSDKIFHETTISPCLVRIIYSKYCT